MRDDLICLLLLILEFLGFALRAGLRNLNFSFHFKLVIILNFFDFEIELLLHLFLQVRLNLGHAVVEVLVHALLE